jgi:GNAT superfamily N-acetyltransferase
MIARSPVLLAAEDGTSVMQFSLAIALVSEPSTDGPKIVGCAALEYYPRSASALLTYAKSRNRAPLTLTSYREAQSRSKCRALVRYLVVRSDERKRGIGRSLLAEVCSVEQHMPRRTLRACMRNTIGTPRHA